jgi:hypothetical protein
MTTWPYSFSRADANEDWTKLGSWDLWNHDGTPVSTFVQMWPDITTPPSQVNVNRVREFTRLACWQAAPQRLKTETARFLMTNAQHGINTTLSVTKVGKEGYIHGWVCVRPPCGAVGDAVSHPDHDQGFITSVDGGMRHVSFTDGTVGILGDESRPAKGFDAYLEPEAAEKLRGLINDNRLSFSSDDADHIRQLSVLKRRMLRLIMGNDFSLSKPVKNGILGFPGFPGADKSTDYLKTFSPDDDGEDMRPISVQLAKWSRSGLDGQDVSEDYERAMSMPEPEIRESDWTGATDAGNIFKFTDQSTAAIQRRQDASIYYGFRAQKVYTQNVLHETKATSDGKSLPLVREVYGNYATRLKTTAADNANWTANVHTLSSWAEPSKKAKMTIQRVLEPVANGETAWLSTTVPQDQVLYHWRGESMLRNGVKILGEVVPASSSGTITSSNVTVSAEMP